MSEPITTALRRLLCARPLGDPCWDAMDAVDAVHAALEAENAELRERVEELDNVGGSMHDGGSITDELREYAKAYEGSATHASLDLIADRIDAEHESACKRERGEGIRIAEEAALDEMEHEYIKLPVDADGVPVHIGDMMECEKLPNGNRVCGEVKAIGDGYVWLMNVQYKIRAEYLHHWHPDSWERIIADAYDGGFRDPDNEHMRARLVERCRALAGDAE